MVTITSSLERRNVTEISEQNTEATMTSRLVQELAALTTLD